MFEAHDKIFGFVEGLTTEANNLPLAACEGNAGLHTELVNAMRAAATIWTRFKYLGVVPWAFSQACRISGARDCLTQYDARPVGEHDSLTVAIMGRLRGDIEERAAGGEISEALAEEVLMLNTAPLDESAGEGYHRGSNCTRIRCAGAKSVYIKQSMRFKQNLAQMKVLQRKYKARGRKVIRFEWKNYKRVLQVDARFR